MIIRSMLLGLCLLGSAQLQASWQLNNEASNLTFVSVKKGKIAEVHHFGSMQGKVSNKGIGKVSIDLASIESNIDTRNQRMKKYLFKVDKFASATIEAKFDSALLNNLTTGQTTTVALPFVLDLHGQQQHYSANVRLTKLVNKILVSSMSPVIINAADFDLIKGIEKLAQLAKLPSIATAVPVTFNLTFEQQ